MSFKPSFDGTINVTEAAAMSDREIEFALDLAWGQRTAASANIAGFSAARLFRLVRENIPGAVTIVLREDTSHLPAHGHLDAILDADGTVLMDCSGDEWHHLSWTGQADEDAWDVYETAGSAAFLTEADGVRRLRITVL